MWLTMPITSPAMLNRGPPESPTLIAASVWKNSARLKPPAVAFGPRRALMCPTVRVWPIPSGAPTTKTSSPTSTASESPSRATRGAAGARSSCRSAMSAAGSDETTRALRISPVRSSTTIASAVWTTCAAVRTFPSADTSTPEPTPATLVGCASPAEGISFSLVRTTTTEGFAFLKISDSLCAPAGAGAAAIRTAAIRMTSRALTIVLALLGRPARQVRRRRSDPARRPVPDGEPVIGTELGVQPAVGEDDRSAHEAGLRPEQEVDERRDFLRLAEAARRGRVAERLEHLAALRPIAVLAEQRSVDEARRDRVHADPGADPLPLHRVVPHVQVDGRLARAVGQRRPGLVRELSGPALLPGQTELQQLGRRVGYHGRGARAHADDGGIAGARQGGAQPLQQGDGAEVIDRDD